MTLPQRIFPKHQADNERLQKQFQGQSDGQKLVPFSAESGQSTSMKVEHNRIQWENNLLVGGLEHVFFDVPNIGNNHPN